ncbi:MAG: DNA translocase FtsK, partial [Microvirga sp.]
MRTTRRSSPYENFSEALRAFLKRRAAELCGLGLIGLAGVVTTALATWSVEDPSLNNATDATVRNLLGLPGAIVADLAMQLFGLASVLLLTPIAVWGWQLVRSRKVRRLHLRLALWIGGSGAATAVASALPATGRWPLPTGLGGVVGDALLGAAKTVLGVSSGAGSALIGFAFAGVAILAITAACGFGVADERPEVPPEGDEPARRSINDDDAAREEEPGWGIISLGALAHGLMSLKAALRRRIEASHARREPALAAAGGAPLRREPVFDAAARAPRRPAPDDDGPGEERGGPEPSRRVAPPPAAPKPGKRLSRDAQPSLLDGERYQLPPLQMLSEPKKSPVSTVSEDALEQNATLLESTLEDFGVRGEIINVRPGPVVTLYELEPAPGTKSSRVISLADDIARSMSAVSARVAVVQGRNAIGIELPNLKRETVYLRELLASQDFESTKHKLALCLGKTIGGEPVIADLARMPHLLVAGTTGSGKSVAINTMILSLIYRLKPEECRLIMVDPKMLELSVYDGIPHLLSPVVTDPKKAVVALKWVVGEMEERYRKMSKMGVRNIDGYNARVKDALAKDEAFTRTVQTGFDEETGEPVFETEAFHPQAMPFIVVIVDEMADLMMVAGKEIEACIQRLAQMARASGIHLIMATQRPSVDVITGTIKANFPT